MNRDTPGAVPSDDLPFLGPAISPRRREAGAPLQDTGELAAPFVGGMFGPPAGSPAPAPEVDAAASADAYEEAAVPAAEEDVLEALPSTDWATDDFPWLIPDEPEVGLGEVETPWRATGELEELARPETAGGVEGGEVDHYTWIGEHLPQERAGEAWETEPAAPGEAGEGTVSWDEAAAESAEASAFVPEAGEYGEVEGDFGVGGEGWGGAAEWGGGEVAEADRFAPEGEREAQPAAESIAWEEGSAEIAPVTAGRWEADEEFHVGDEGVGTAEAEPVEAEPVESAFAEASPAAAGEPPVEAAPLPVGEWEAAPADGQVEAEPAAAGWSAGAADPLAEVADRLERIARSLRSGKPIEAVEEGDPLQLLITGYALGYSQARRGRS